MTPSPLHLTTIVGGRLVAVFLMLLLWPTAGAAVGSAAESRAGLSADEMCALVRSATPTQITEAIAAGAQVKNAGVNQRTPLMEAVMWGVNAEVIATLLPASDVNAVGWNGRTALMWTGWSATGRACKAERSSWDHVGENLDCKTETSLL